MRNLAVTGVCAAILFVVAFAMMSKRIAHVRSGRQIQQAEQEAMFGPGGIPPEPRPEAPKITDTTDSRTLLDMVRNAQPTWNEHSVANIRASKALSILVDRKESGALDVLLESVRHCPKAPLCEDAIHILSQRWRDERAIEPLTAAASMGYIKAVETLGAYYLPQSRDSLIPLMRHDHPQIRAVAARYLSNSLRKDPVVVSAVQSAMDSGTSEVAAAFWPDYLEPRYKQVILAAFESRPGAFGALKSPMYIHRNNMAVMREELIIVGDPDYGFLRKRLEKLLDDPEHYKLTP